MRLLLIAIFILETVAFGQYPGIVGSPGTTAIHKDSSIIVGWANKVISFNPGPQDISDGTSPLADFGDSTNALGYAEGNSTDVISLGDGGTITLGFPYPIMNGTGFDFAIFENSFTEDFLEFAHVEVSSDGVNYVRFPSHSLVQTNVQVGGFELTNTEKINNLAGKYQQGYGTPFDLEDLVDSTGINLDSVQFIRLVDVIGSINTAYGSTDSYGNMINEPFPTFFPSCGFDLDAIGMINVNGVYVTDVEDNEFDFSVYPNPAQNNVFVNYDLSVDNKVTLKIMSFEGKVVYANILTTTDGTIEISTADLADGIYFINIQSDNMSKTVKLIIAR